MADMTREQAVEALCRVRALLQDTPALQGRENIVLGMDFNDAINYFAALRDEAGAEAVAWLVGEEVFTSESEAAEAIRQWGPSGAIATPLYTRPAPQPEGGVTEAMVEAQSSADYIEYCAEKLRALGYRFTAKVLHDIAGEHRSLAAQPAEQPAVAEGFVMVPVELSEEMRWACQSVVDLEIGDPEDPRHDDGRKTQDEMWAAILATAPKPEGSGHG